MKYMKMVNVKTSEKKLDNIHHLGDLNSSLLYSYFGRYVIRPSGVSCRTRKPTQKLELDPSHRTYGEVVKEL